MLLKSVSLCITIAGLQFSSSTLQFHHRAEPGAAGVTSPTLGSLLSLLTAWYQQSVPWQGVVASLCALSRVCFPLQPRS